MRGASLLPMFAILVGMLNGPMYMVHEVSTANIILVAFILLQDDADKIMRN